MKDRLCMMVLLAGVAWGSSAHAHITVGSGPATANSNNEVTFTVGHGCAGADTYRVTIDIPSGVTGVRPLRSDFGAPSVEKDLAGTITSVTWQKSLADALAADIALYKLVIRMKTPDQAFSTLYFAAHQTCRAADGTMTTVDWVGTPAQETDGGTVEPAPGLLVVPARLPGWNKYKLTGAMTDLSVFFKDAQIVWQGTSAYSANPSTVALIAGTSGVTPLTALKAGDEIWVKY